MPKKRAPTATSSCHEKVGFTCDKLYSYLDFIQITRYTKWNPSINVGHFNLNKRSTRTKDLWKPGNDVDKRTRDAPKFDAVSHILPFNIVKVEIVPLSVGSFCFRLEVACLPCEINMAWM